MARALNDTVSAGCPAIGSGTLATSVAGPALLPRVQTTVAMPCASVRVVAALSEPRGTEVMGTLVTISLTGEGGGRVGIGSAYGMVLFVLCIGFIIWYVINNFRENES